MSPLPVILIFDGAKFHLGITTAEKAEAHGIHLYCLPSNTTHELLPMDIGMMNWLSIGINILLVMTRDLPLW